MNRTKIFLFALGLGCMGINLGAMHQKQTDYDNPIAWTLMEYYLEDTTLGRLQDYERLMGYLEGTITSQENLKNAWFKAYDHEFITNNKLDEQLFLSRLKRENTRQRELLKKIRHMQPRQVAEQFDDLKTRVFLPDVWAKVNINEHMLELSLDELIEHIQSAAISPRTNCIMTLERHQLTKAMGATLITSLRDIAEQFLLEVEQNGGTRLSYEARCPRVSFGKELLEALASLQQGQTEGSMTSKPTNQFMWELQRIANGVLSRSQQRSVRSSKKRTGSKTSKRRLKKSVKKNSQRIRA